MILRDVVLILNWKENKEAGAICFEISILREQKIMEVILLWKETKTFSGLSMIMNIIIEKWS